MRIMIYGILLLLLALSPAKKTPPEEYKLVWSDEFNKDGRPDTTNWTYENGFVRNDEAQWYQPDNARCENGCLVIEARREHKPNPWYTPGEKDWRKNRPFIDYTSACLETRGLREWRYGRFVMRARIDISAGLWPAWWTLGKAMPWPADGEIDIMEYYRGMLLANIACLGAGGQSEWFSRAQRTDSLGGLSWAAKFHVWRMDWDTTAIALYVDDALVNRVPLTALTDKAGFAGFEPFKQPHYMILNLAVGGQNGGDPDSTSLPRRFEVDYIRVYKKTNQ